MKKILTAVLVASLLSACVRSIPNAMPISQAGDETKSCHIILSEMQEVKNVRTTAEGDRKAQIGTNIALGVTGIFLLVPWFFIDTSNAHTVEINAAENRYNRLQAMAIEKKCSDVNALYK